MYMLIVGILFLFGAISGQMVLRGTESSVALGVVSVIFIGIGIYQLVDSRSPARPRKTRKVRGKVPAKRLEQSPVMRRNLPSRIRSKR